jgi:hypothetical protein
MGSLEQKEHDQRILGNPEFLVQLRRMKPDPEPSAIRMPIEDLVERVAGVFELEGVEIKSSKRGRKVTDARSIISDLAVRVIVLSPFIPPTGTMDRGNKRRAVTKHGFPPCDIGNIPYNWSPRRPLRVS